MAHKKKFGIVNFNPNVFKNFVFILLLALVVFNVLSLVWQQKEKYFTFNYWQNFSSLEKTFLGSQYVNKHPKGWISDEAAFSYAGGMLIRGTNPVLVVPDAPPLGKYIIGASAQLFNNENISVLFFGIFSLVVLYFLGLQILSDRAYAIIPVFLLTFEPIFKNQFIYVPLLDIFQLFFLLCCFYFFNKAYKNKRSLVYFSLANLFLGFFIATKFFITGFIIVVAYYLVLILAKDKKRLIQLTMTLPISLFILLFSYIRVFAFGYTFSKFLGIQKWVFLYHKSFLILPLSVWPLLLLNKWYVWFGNKPVISDAQWSVSWPVITVVSILTIILYILKKIPRNKNIEVLMAWFFFYMLFLSFGQVFSRYFVIMVPILYIISTYGLVSMYNVLKR